MNWFIEPISEMEPLCQKQCNDLCRDKYACGIKVCGSLGLCRDYICAILLG